MFPAQIYAPFDFNGRLIQKEERRNASSVFSRINKARAER
jgi:hypothetical protein